MTKYKCVHDNWFGIQNRKQSWFMRIPIRIYIHIYTRSILVIWRHDLYAYFRSNEKTNMNVWYLVRDRIKRNTEPYVPKTKSNSHQPRSFRTYWTTTTNKEKTSLQHNRDYSHHAYHLEPNLQQRKTKSSTFKQVEPSTRPLIRLTRIAPLNDGRRNPKLMQSYI